MNAAQFSTSLDPEKIQPFLDFMFQSLCRRTKRLTFNQAIPVIAYFVTLSQKGLRRGAIYPDGGRQIEPDERRARSAAFAFAQSLCATLLQFGDTTPCSSIIAKEFLEQHRNTYFADQNFETLTSLIEDFEIPSGIRDRTQHMVMMSSLMQLQTEINPNRENARFRSNLLDDASERIFAAYWLLKDFQNRSDLIAESLNKFGVERPRRVADMYSRHEVDSPDPVWDERAVMERQRMFERLNLKLPRTKSLSILRDARLTFRFTYTYKWIMHFRDYQFLNSEIEKGVRVDSVS